MKDFDSELFAISMIGMLAIVGFLVYLVLSFTVRV